MNVSGARINPRAGRPLSTLRAALGSLLLSLLFQPSHLAAQSSTTGAISGRVIDISGHPIPGVYVTVSDAARGRRLSIFSSSDGEFFAPALQPTEYDVDFRSPGFRPEHVRGISVRLGADARLSTVLVPGTVEAQVTVSSDLSSDIEDPGEAISSGIFSSEISRLPLDGRRWQTLALLTPEANAGSSTDDIGLLSFHGIGPTQNSSRIDGGDDDQSFNASPHGSGTDSGPEAEDDSDSEGQSSSSSSGRNFSSGSGSGRRPGAAFTFSQAAVREFRVAGQNYTALYGHAAGGIVTTISKSGTDTLHGTLFFLIRESAWAATNPFSIVTRYNNGTISSGVIKPDDHRIQFGGSVGGPLAPKRYPNRFFYFMATDAQRRSFPAVSSPENPAFYNLTPTQRALLGNRGVTANKIDSALVYLDSLTGTVPRRADQTVNFLKLEGQLTPRNQLRVQYNRSRFSSPAGIRSAPVVNRGTRSFGSQNISIDSILSQWIYSRSTILSNELRLQYNRDLHSEEPQTPLAQEPAIGIGGLSPEVAIGPQGFNFGTTASIGKRAAPDEHRVQLADVATLVHERHLLQAGFDYSYVHDFTDSLTNTVGTFHYDSGTTGGRAGGLVDWITDYTFNVNTYPNGGCPSIGSAVHDFCFRSFSQSFGQQTAAFSTQEFAAFLHDRWRPRENLSFTAGLRFEYELLPIPQHPNPEVDTGFNTRGATSIFPEDRNNFGPRVAAAWQPFGHRGGTVRIAYGLYFGRVPGATIRSALVNTATSTSATQIHILPTTVTGCPQVSNQGFGYPCTYTTAPPSGVAATTSVTVFDRHFRLPMLQQGSMSLERDIGRVATLSATYLLNLDRQLANSVDINIAPSTSNRTFQLQGGAKAVGVRDGDTFVLPIYNQRVNTSFGPVTAINSNANASYNAVVLEARHRSREGIEFKGSWTWSKSIDFGQDSGSVPRTNGQFDPFNVAYDKSLSALNFPHKVVASAVWRPMPAFTSSVLQRLAEGWLLAPLFVETSGRPYSYNVFGGTRLTGGHESINGSGGDLYLPTVGRNTLRLPDSYNVDLRLSRDVPLGERLNISATLEAFNLTNHANYTATTERAFLVGPTTSSVTALIFQDAAAIAAAGNNARPFGTLTSSVSQSARERQLQFGLRLEF